jgi:iron-sulfur cluster assembly protein
MIQVSDNLPKKIIDLMSEDGFDAATDYVRVGVADVLVCLMI